MAGTTVRLTDETRAVLRELARESQESMQAVLAKAVEAYRRQRLLDQTNEAYAAVRQDTHAWQTLLEERTEWDATLEDHSAET